MDFTPPAAQPVLAPEDYYFEGGNMVFTAACHLKRGFCCGSGCRHCPYEASASEAGSASPEIVSPEH